MGDAYNTKVEKVNTVLFKEFSEKFRIDMTLHDNINVKKHLQALRQLVWRKLL